MKSLLLDITRFPGRKWLRVEQSLAHAPHVRPPTRETLLRLRWARALQVQPADLVLCSSPTQALRAVLHALMAPADLAVLAAPTAPDVASMVLGLGGRFVDVGRQVVMPGASGAWREGGAALALNRHPDAVVLLEAPNIAGGDDRVQAQELHCRAAIVDWRRHVGIAGPRPDTLTQLRSPTFHIVALRDPDLGAPAVLGAVVAPPGSGDILRAVLGAVELPDHQLDHALGVLEGAALTPSWQDQLTARVTTQAQEWHTLASMIAGVVVLPPAGLTANLLLMSKDDHNVLRLLRTRFPATDLHFQGGPRAWVTSLLTQYVPPTAPAKTTVQD